MTDYEKLWIQNLKRTLWTLTKPHLHDLTDGFHFSSGCIMRFKLVVLTATTQLLWWTVMKFASPTWTTTKCDEPPSGRHLTFSFRCNLHVLLIVISNQGCGYGSIWNIKAPAPDPDLCLYTQSQEQRSTWTLWAHITIYGVSQVDMWYFTWTRVRPYNKTSSAIQLIG